MLCIYIARVLYTPVARSLYIPYLQPCRRPLCVVELPFLASYIWYLTHFSPLSNSRLAIEGKGLMWARNYHYPVSFCFVVVTSRATTDVWVLIFWMWGGLSWTLCHRLPVHLPRGQILRCRHPCKPQSGMSLHTYHSFPSHQEKHTPLEYIVIVVFLFLFGVGINCVVHWVLLNFIRP